jgi:hypothetical protein
MTIVEDYKARAELDSHTLAWWNEKLEGITKGYRGACHGTNLAIAQCEECGAKCDSLRAEIEVLRKELATVVLRVDKASEYIKKHVPKNGGEK